MNINNKEKVPNTQGNLDFSKKKKSYLDYSREEIEGFVNSIRAKHIAKKPLSPEEIEFQELNMAFYEKDDQPEYRH